MARFVALLRGINVGGNAKVPMAELRELLAQAGYDKVSTLLNSGNVVLSSSLKPAAARADIEQVIHQGFGLDVKVVVRTAAELAKIVAANPFVGLADDPAKQVVVFLSAAPPASKWAAIAGRSFAPEQFRLLGREVHLWCPGGLGRSQLAPFMVDKRLGVVATGRNWNTVLKLVDLVN